MSESNGKSPDRTTLEFLSGMMPSFTKGFVERSVNGRGKPIGPAKITTFPKKLCNVCGKPHDITSTAHDTVPLPEPCPDCEKLLKEGYIAFISGDEYLFAKSERLSDMAGTVALVSPIVFGHLKKHYEQEWATKESEKPDEPTGPKQPSS